MKLILATILILLLPVWAGAVFDWYEDFEGETVNTAHPADGSGCSDYLYNGTNYPTQNCSNYIRAAGYESIPARYGGQFLDAKCNYGGCETWAQFDGSQRTHIVYGRPAGWSPCHTMKTSDGTEYWMSWSNYIPADYYEEYFNHMNFEILVGGTVLSPAIYYGGDAAHDRTNYRARVYSNGGAQYPSLGGTWADDKGTWVDWTVRAVWYNVNNANTALQIWRNGSLVYTKTGGSNMPADSTGAIMVWVQYNPANYISVYPERSQRDTFIRACDDDGVGVPTPWRRIPIDEMRVTENTIDSVNYCDVTAPIWSSTPTITVPAADATGIGQTFTAEFSAYADHRTDAQVCFAGYRMNVEVDAGSVGSPADWAGLTYDSGDVSTAATNEVSGLGANTEYQIRVRHSSYNTSTTTEYWGEWSATTSFTTTTGGAPADPFDDILQWINFDDGSEAAGVYTLHANLEKSGNDNTGDLINNAVINATAGIIGTNGLDCPGAGDYINFAAANDTDCDPAGGRAAGWIDVNTWADGGLIFRVIQGADNVFYIEKDSDDELRWTWRDNGTSRTTWDIDNTVLESAGPHFIEFIWDTAANTREVKINNVSIDSADGNRLAEINDFAGAITGIQWGSYGATASDSYLDNIMISNDKNRDFYALRNQTEYPGYARLGAIGTTGQNGSYGIGDTLTVPIMFVDGDGTPKEVTWTDAAVPYGYLLTETGVTDLRLYHSSPPTTVAASTHWFSTHATDANYVNSMIVADMISADLTVSSIELEGGTFTAVIDIPAGENLADNSAVIIDGSAEGLSNAVIALCDSDGVAIGANTTTSTASTIYASITFANSEAGYVSIGPVGGLGMPIVLSNGALTLTYAATQPSGWGQGYNEWLLEGTLFAGDRDDGAECVLDGTALTKPTETKIEANGNELSDYDWPATDILSGFTWRVIIPYPSTSPKEFSSTSTLAAAQIAGFYAIGDDYLGITDAGGIGAADMSASDGTSGHPITLDGGGFEDNNSKTYGDYWVITRSIS